MESKSDDKFPFSANIGVSITDFIAPANARVTAINLISPSLSLSTETVFPLKNPVFFFTNPANKGVHCENNLFNSFNKSLNILDLSEIALQRVIDTSISAALELASEYITLAFSRFSSAFKADEIPVKSTTGAATTDKGVIAAPKDKAELAKVPANANSPAKTLLPAIVAKVPTTGNAPLAASPIIAPVAAPVAIGNLFKPVEISFSSSISL